MFVLIPWKVDVPEERWPLMNWLVMTALVSMFALQLADMAQHTTERHSSTHEMQRRDGAASEPRADSPTGFANRKVPGLTGELMLTGWSLKGLFGYMWLHGGLFHLGGNLLFLWIFGNAVCAKLGNLRYLALYLLCGVAAGVFHLLFSSRPALGASGAINGVVGMYLVLFYENEITCLFVWFFPPILRNFDVSSFWMILLWLVQDILGALWGSSGVAYFAHLGGFGTGFAVVMVLCYRGWVTMERYEGSLLQAWQKRRNPDVNNDLDMTYARLGLTMVPDLAADPSPVPPPIPVPIPLPEPAPPAPRNQTIIRTVCACGKDITVTRQYVGKTVRCPACSRGVVIPQATDFFGPAPRQAKATPLPTQADSHSIHFACTCGKRIKVPARYAGRSGTCPRCGRRLKIPSASV